MKWEIPICLFCVLEVFFFFAIVFFGVMNFDVKDERERSRNPRFRSNNAFAETLLDVPGTSALVE